MKPMATYAFLAAGLLGTLLGAGLAHAQPMAGGWAHHDHGRFTDALNLTADQQASAKQLRKDLRAKAEPLMQQERQQMEELKALLDGAHPDATEVGTKMLAAHATREQLRALHDEFTTKFSQLLTADQKAKFERFQAMRQEFGGHHMGFGFGPPPPAEEN